MVMERIQAMLESCITDSPLFPPTLLYNEGWLLRLVLDWFSTHNVSNHPLSFSKGARWFSEGLLPSAFLATPGGDPLAEGWTHADGAVGHFKIGEEGKTDLLLLPGATQLIILEAKMFGRLSSGVTHARYFDQAARTVGCIAEVLKRAERHPSNLTQLGFYVLAPQLQIDGKAFVEHMSLDSIEVKMQRRVKAYEGDRDQWYTEWFQPTLQGIEVDAMSWEGVIEAISEHDSASASSIEEFYQQCLRFNQ